MFFSSHQLAEVEQIADHVAIIDRGQTVVSGALDDLRAQYQRIQLVFEADAPEIKVHAPGTPSRAAKGPRPHDALFIEGGAAIIEELRGYRPASIRRVPGHAEGHFSRVGTNGGLTCCGTKRGLKPGGASSARW